MTDSEKLNMILFESLDYIRVVCQNSEHCIDCPLYCNKSVSNFKVCLLQEVPSFWDTSDMRTAVEKLVKGAVI